MYAVKEGRKEIQNKKMGSNNELPKSSFLARNDEARRSKEVDDIHSFDDHGKVEQLIAFVT